jgi:hypothetical protein
MACWQTVTAACKGGHNFGLQPVRGCLPIAVGFQAEDPSSSSDDDDDDMADDDDEDFGMTDDEDEVPNKKKKKESAARKPAASKVSCQAIAFLL